MTAAYIPADLTRTLVLVHTTHGERRHVGYHAVATPGLALTPFTAREPMPPGYPLLWTLTHVPSGAGVAPFLGLPWPAALAAYRVLTTLCPDWTIPIDEIRERATPAFCRALHDAIGHLAVTLYPILAQTPAVGR
jgi:hypothetical protein